MGMIARNAVILIEQIETERAQGRDVWDAVVEATVSRFRPIMLTAISTVLGFIPIAPTVFWGPMAFAIMGGLFVATLLTLIVLPALYVTSFRVEEPESAARRRSRISLRRMTQAMERHMIVPASAAFAPARIEISQGTCARRLCRSGVAVWCCAAMLGRAVSSSCFGWFFRPASLADVAVGCAVGRRRRPGPVCACCRRRQWRLQLGCAGRSSCCAFRVNPSSRELTSRGARSIRGCRLQPGFVIYRSAPCRRVRAKRVLHVDELAAGNAAVRHDDSGGAVIHCLDVRQPVLEQLAAEEALLAQVVGQASARQ